METMSGVTVGGSAAGAAVGGSAAGPAGAAGAASPASPTVIFGNGRPESATRVTLESFDGPLALLLALIEARQLDVLTVPLGALAEAYLDALAALDGDRLGNVSTFVAVASQLILIKSRAILPRPPQVAPHALDDEPDPEADLRARLIEYRSFRDAGMRLAARIEAGLWLHRRDVEVAAAAGRAGARPPERPPLPPSVLTAALGRLIRIVPIEAAPTELVARRVTLADRAAVIRAALRRADAVVLQELLGGVRDRVVVAVTFLAMLELSKRREVTLEQSEPWGPIVARRLKPVEPDDGSPEAGDVESIEGEDEFDEALGTFA